MIRRLFAILALNAVLAFGPVCFAEVEPPVPWLGETWQYRQIVAQEISNPNIKALTGIAEIETQGNVLPEGADIRVTDLANNIMPYQVQSVSKEGLVKVEFKLNDSATDNAYCVYYGDTSAKPLAFNLGQATGALNLAIKAYESGEINDIETFSKVFDAAQKTIGQGVRPCINDQSNPFSKEYERCLAQYTGILRAQQDGSYGFQLKATGPAFVSIDGKTVVSQQVAQGLFTTAESVQLTRGDHLIRFCVFSRHPSSYIAELYWRIPGERIFQVIPPENFSSSVNFSPVIRQRRGRILNAFFTFNVERKLRLVRIEDVFTAVKFRSLSFDSLGFAAADSSSSGESTSGPSERLRVSPKVEWSFGDGEKSVEPDPLHIYRKAGQYTVTLTAKNDMGYKDIYSMPVSISSDGAERLEMQWEILEDAQLIDFDAKEIEVRQSFYMSSIGDKEFTLRTIVTTEGKVIDSAETPLKLSSRKAVVQSIKIPNLKGSFEVRWSLCLSNINIMSKGLRIIEDTDKFPVASSKDTSVIDTENNLVIVKVTGSANTSRRVFRNIFNPEKQKKMTIAVIDNSLAPFGAGYDENTFYYKKLQSLLQNKFQGVEVEVKRFAQERGQLGYFPIYRIISTAPQIYSADPDVIVIAPDIDDLNCFTESEVLSRYYAIMIHNYIANTRAKIVLVTPPPRPEKAHRSKIFATTISKIGLVHEVGLADVYQAVSLYEGDWKMLFRGDNGSDNVYYLYINAAGQDIIADTLLMAITMD